jgi:UDP-N-acetylmuramate dehydrogenase
LVFERISGTLAGMTSDHPPSEDAKPTGVRGNVSLRELTSLELGGSARHFVEVQNEDAVGEVVRWARQHDLPLAILGGGSNVVVADSGWEGMLLRMAMRGIVVEDRGDEVMVTAAAGESWDGLVEEMVGEGLAGVECLSGIPGLVGATPIQNVGAYGQEVAAVIESIRAFDLASLEVTTLLPADCRFGYRTSRFRESPGRYLVLSVTYRMRPGAPATVTYRELQRSLGTRRTHPTLADVREAVLELRRGKSMVLDPSDANRRSVGSFFVNPVLDASGLIGLEERARAVGALAPAEQLPSFAAEEGSFKVPAAWLIERSGFPKGLRRGSVGVSGAHALSLVHYGGGTTADLVALARDVRRGVLDRFRIELRPEPVFLGFPTSNPLANV